jgi:CBS domain-containing protein
MGAKARPIEVDRLRRAGKGHHIGEGLLPARSLDRHRLMLVQDLMQRDVFTLAATDTLDVADDVMRLGRIRHIPVVAEGALVGILSQRDLFRAGLSSLLQLKYTAERDWLAAIPIRAVMTTCVFTAHPRTTIQEAVTIMLDKKIGCLPVVEDDRLVGLLSESDCLRYLAHLLEVAAEKDVLPELPPG